MLSGLAGKRGTSWNFNWKLGGWATWVIILVFVEAIIVFRQLTCKPAIYHEDSHDFPDATDYLSLVINLEEGSAYTFYIGQHAVCEDSVLADVRVDFNTTLFLCLANPNCTFVSYSVGYGGHLCSGRAPKLEGMPRPKTVLAEPARGLWISADRKGCESFDSDKSKEAKARQMLPSCAVNTAVGEIKASSAEAVPVASGSCYYLNPATGRCLSDWLVFMEDGRLLSATGGMLCRHKLFGLIFENSMVVADQTCKWEKLSEGYNFRNKDTGELLFPRLLEFKNGFLRKHGQCLCHNKQSGMVVGAYCGNGDCKWSVETAGCLFKNKATDTCLLDLLYTAGYKLNCLCQNLTHGLYHGNVCQDDTCEWQFRQGMGFNKASGKPVQTLVTYQRDSSLLAEPWQYLCTRDSILGLSGEAPSRHCNWQPAGRSLAIQRTGAAKEFSVRHQERLHCAVQLMPPLYTESLKEALDLCLTLPSCTFVAFHSPDGQTLLCSGYFKGVDWRMVGFQFWVSAVRKGCEHYLEQQAYVDTQLGVLPKCYHSHHCTCREKLFPVLTCTPKESAICDVCSAGYCAVYPSTYLVPSFESPLETLISKMDSQHGLRPFNPSIFKYRKKTYVAFRSANNTYCEGFSYKDQQGTTFSSSVGICEVDGDSLVPFEFSCHIVNIPFSVLHQIGEPADVHPVFRGLEDSRAFAYKGQVYLLGSMNLYSRSTGNTGLEQRAAALVKLDSELKNVEKGWILQLEHLPKRLYQKNWMPLVADGKMYFVTSTVPLEIVTMDLQTGRCALAQPVAHQDVLSSLPVANDLRGGTPFAAIDRNKFLGIVHRRVEYTFGPVFSHHLLVLEPDSLGTFRVTWVSESFRFPELPAVKLQDIQFATGLLVLGSDVLISYGVSDCHSALARIQGFKEKLPFVMAKLYQSAGNNIARVHPLDKDGGSSMLPTVRWEGPTMDLSSFATVARELGSRLLQLGKDSYSLRFSDLSVKQVFDLNKHPQFRHLHDQIITANKEHNSDPDVVVRFSWPVNLNAPTARIWIQYLPWEFNTVPKDWVEVINTKITELWVPSSFCRDAFVASGVAANKVQVVPHGVDPSSSCTSFTLPTRPKFITVSKSFIFLYDGGGLWRKGMDLLLQAFVQAFTSKDDVALVMHAVYGEDDVMKAVHKLVTECWQDPTKPQVQLLDKELTAEEHAMMYSVAAVYVHAARGEGYGLTLAEAMSCGLPVIATNYGGQLDFLNSANSILVNATLVQCTKHPCGQESNYTTLFDMETVDTPLWAEIDVPALADAMKEMHRNSGLRTRLARHGQQSIRDKVTWEHAADIAVKRIKTLLKQYPAKAEVQAEVQADSDKGMLNNAM